MTPTLALVTNIPTPYRLAFFDVLHERLAQRGLALDVTYCAETEANRHWTVDLRPSAYTWRVLPGLHPRRGDVTAHLNPGVVRTMRAMRPSWMLLAGSWNTPTIVLAQSRLCGGAPRIFWSEGHEAAVSVRGGIVGRARRVFYRRCDGFAVPNGASAEYASAEAGRAMPMLPLPNTVNEEFYGAARALDRRVVRARVGVEDDRLLAVTVAQLEDRKGVLELARAYAAAPPLVRKRVVLAIVGSGSLAAELRGVADALPNGLLLLPGHCPPETVRDWLAAADAFVLPTKRDPNPLSVIEAAFAGKPLFVSERAGNARDLVIEGRTGYLHDPGNAGALRHIFERLASAGPDVLSVMGDAAARLACARFTRAAVAEAFLDELVRAFPRSSET